MAQGEKVWSSSTAVMSGPVKMDPLPAKIWDGLLKTDRAEIRKKDENSAPYINFYIEAQDSAAKEGQKNRGLYAALYLGDHMLGKTDGLKGLCLALGTEIEGLTLMEGTDGEGKTFDYADPQEVLAFLKQQNGQAVRFKSKIEKGTNGYADKAKLMFYVENTSSGPA